MIWLDLALGCLLVWGVVSGYYSGWRISACRLGGLICTVLAALPGMAGLRLLWKRYWPVEEVIRAAVDTRLALPVSSGTGGNMSPRGLPCFLLEALYGNSDGAAVVNGGLTADPLARLLVCTAAFLSGYFLWWGFFSLFGAKPAGEDKTRFEQSSRWGGALIGLIRQCCAAVLLTGLAAPLAWLCGFPSHLLQLEKTFLVRWAWQFFGCLGIWH